VIPLLLIRGYRRLPGHWRSVLGGPPSSMIALQYAEETGRGWYAIWRWCLKPALWWFAGAGPVQERGGPSWSDPRDV
jgi:hypothetical protein